MSTVRRAVLRVVAVLGVLAATAVPAQAKSFEVRAVQIEAALQPDASMHVVEHLTYAFSGEFHNGTRPIPPSPTGDYEITDMAVTENGRPLPFEGAPYNLTWHFDARDEMRTFDISYTVLRAAKVGTDVAELYWQWVGRDHPTIGRARVSLTVPGDGLDVRAWGHGPLNGLVEPRGNEVLWSVDGLPAGQFLEGRVAVPAAAFTAPGDGTARLPGILEEEQRLADEANAQRARSAESDRRQQQIRRLLRDTFFVLPILGWIVFVVLWLRYGREYKATTDVGEYVREPPDDAPAYVPTLFNWGTVEPVALSATIVDLAQRGHLTIEEIRTDRRVLPDKVDWRFTWKDDREPVRDFEAAVLAQLFQDGPTTTQSEFTAWARAHQTDAQRWWDDVKREIRKGFKAKGYIEGGKGGVYAANVFTALVVGGVGIATVSTGVALGAVAIVSAVVQLLATIVLRRRTPAGRQRLAEWKAFEHFLRDFSQLEEAPIGHLVLWERYLVYAVALGVTAQVARALAAKIPAPTGAVGQPAFAPWFIGYHGTALDSIGSFADFAHDFGPAIVAAATPQSSSSSGGGFGGGFSGGGGGGGGGGGIGAS
ncbi:MAG TPA: DUF2207 domain-containing protein [Acidimicrobiales bacterium]|nr:DUF2207 domain-containing protein [Acidimicrobiales bacterium]